MARAYRDPTDDPEATRRALVDQLDPQAPAAPDPPMPTLSGPLDPSAGPNPVSPPRSSTQTAEDGYPDQGTTNPDNTNQPAPNQPPPLGSPTGVPPPAPPDPTNNYGAIADPSGQVTNRINPITGRPLGPNDSASITNLGTQLGSGGAPDPTATLADWMAHNNPQGHQDASYWLRRIAETGGLNAGNLDYWKGRFMEAPGTHVEGPTGGFSGSNATAFQNFGLDPNTTAYNQRMRDFMLSQLGVLSGPTNAESEDIAPALSAYNTQSQRDQQRDRDAIAERFYATGEGGNALQSGGFNTAVQQGREAAAGNRANFAGSTIFNAAQAKRTQLNELLRSATSAGLTEQAQQIQMQIAKIDADLRQQGITNQNAQFGDRLGFDYADLRSRMNRDALLSGLNG